LDLVTSTEDQEVMNQVKDLRNQVRFQNNKSRFRRYPEMPMTTTI